MAAAERPRSRWVGPGVAIVIAASVGVATLAGSGERPDEERPGDRRPVAVSASPAERFATVEALFAASDLVVRGTVVDISRGRVVGARSVALGSTAGCSTRPWPTSSPATAFRPPEPRDS